MYRLLEQRTRTQVPVLRERAAGLNRRIRELCETGPLLDFVHAGEAAAESLETQLRSLKQAESAMIMTRSWKTPLMAFAIAMVACLVGFVLSVRILTPDSQVTISAAFALCASLAATTFAFLRIERAWVAQAEGKQAAQVLLTMFEQPELPVQNNLITLVDRFTDQLKLEHVTLQDSEGRKLLSDVSINMKPGQLVAIVGNRRLQAKALAELILGFGRPTSGRMLIDHTNTIDIDPQAFRSQCAWIAPDGPLVPGTIEDNLHANGRPASMAELMDALRLAGTYEAIQNLPDGLATMVTPHDDRLSPDHLFRLGIARALTKKPMLVVAEEPSAPVSQQQEAGTLAALRQMTSRGVLVVTLPERLSTLRDADMIVVLNDHQVDSIGKHNQLLQTSELYRHLNYLRFSELRGVSLQ
jgi:ATP-binding cassette, subfamily B, bacterial